LKRIEDLTETKKKALNQNPINWNSYHMANREILSLLPN